MVDLLRTHGKGYSTDSSIEPLYAAEVLRRLPNNFNSQRLKALFLKERDRRVKSCRSEEMRSYVMSIFSLIPDTVIGSYDPKEDSPEYAVPSRRPEPRLAQVIELPIRGVRCRSNGEV